VSEIVLSDRLADPHAKSPGGPRRGAIAAAALLHAAIAAWLLFDWDTISAPEPPSMVATLVTVLPPPPPPPPPPPFPKPRPVPTLAPAQSGPGEKTTMRPPAEEKAPAPEPPPPAAAETPAPPKPQETAAPEPEQPALEQPAPAPPEKPKPRPAPRVEPRKDQLASRAPEISRKPDNFTQADKDETGDPYLNAVWARIERNREPTTPVGPSGLHLEGISVYEVLLDRAGRMQTIYLVQSAGSPLLDEQARRMIVAATPFPPPPPNYPERTAIKVTIRLFPR